MIWGCALGSSEPASPPDLRYWLHNTARLDQRILEALPATQISGHLGLHQLLLKQVGFVPPLNNPFLAP